MATPPGFASCSYELKHSAMSRSAFITFGVDPTETDPTTIAGLLASSFAVVSSLCAAIDSSVQLQSTRVSLGTDGVEDIVGSSPTVVPCTRALNSLPANCATLVHKTTARGGRRGRGRFYIPWSASNTGTGEGGVLGSSDVTAVQNAVNSWRTDVATRVGPLVLLHRASAIGTQHPTTPGPPNVITNMIVDPLVATQRRRLGR
jgi:hypothetical protein